MAKINITFNNKTYSVDESSLSAATSVLKQHLSTVMNGTGATVNLGGNAYNIDSAKLQAATNAFVSHLDTIAGSGSTVTVNGTEYSIDSAKLQGAISELEAVLSGTGEERLEGDGAEYYTLAPTALSFRSTAPLNELQEVQVNGVTVDPSNYTLEEGSTIVTFPIDYLKTLDVGDYEVAVASNSKTVKGGFSVKEPKLSEYGFYCNQPYVAYVDMFGGNVIIMLDEVKFKILFQDGSKDSGVIGISSEGNIELYTSSLGMLNMIASDNGAGICNVETGITFVLNDEIVVADEDYIYIYSEELGGYTVSVINDFQYSYSAIRTGIYGRETVALGTDMFRNNCNLIIAPIIPDTVAQIGVRAFENCDGLVSVTIPSNVTFIGEYAFSSCSKLVEVVNKSSMKIDATSYGLDGTEVNSESKIVNKDGYLFYTINGVNYLIGYVGLDTELVLPADYNGQNYEIYKYAFNYYEKIDSIVIPDNVVDIGECAFYRCTLKNAIINSKSIGYKAFYESMHLDNVTIGNNVTSIGDYAFMDSGINSVTIGNNVTSIGDNAFNDCRQLTSITFGGTTEQWNAITFVDDGNLATSWNTNVPATYVQCSDGQVAI